MLLRLLATALTALVPMSAFAFAKAPLVSGNGYGFAVYGDGAVTKLYAHPYSFTRPDDKDPLSEGVPTANFVTKMSWDTLSASADYDDNSHIITAGDQAFFMPFGLARHVLIATWRGSNPAPALCVEWAHPIAEQQQLDGGVQSFRFSGIDETLLVIPIGPAGAVSTCFSGHPTWAFASIENPRDIAKAVAEITAYASGNVVEKEYKALEAWRVKPPASLNDAERKLWRQSEVVLRMGQSREPNRSGRNNNGLILAALPDTGLFCYWVRDMAYAIHALIGMGHKDEARRGIMAYFNAQPIGRMNVGAPYQISVVRYFGNGAEEPYFTQEGSTNIEFDDWGLVLWVLGEYIDRFGDAAILQEPTYRGTVGDSVKTFIVAPLVMNLEPYKGGLIVKADTSIWEERQKDAKHFAFSTLMALVGLEKFGDKATVDRLKKGFAKAFTTPARLRGTLEPGPKNDIDGAVLSAINLGVVTDPKVIRATVQAMARLKEPSGGYRRVTCILKDPTIFEYWYERQEFVFIDFSLAEVYLRMHEPEKAEPLVSTIVAKAANDHFFVPEMYVSVSNPLFTGDVGDPTGGVPMVGYGAGAFIAYALERDRLIAAR